MGEKLPPRREFPLKRVKKICSQLRGVGFALFTRRGPYAKLFTSPDTEDSEQCASTWEQSILAEAQTLWPTGRLEMEYTTIFDGRHSTPAHPATYWARLVWKMQLDAPHDAYTTVLHVHLSIPKEYANDQWRYRIRCALLQSLHKLVEKKLQKKFPSSDLAGCMIKEWSNMADRKAPPAYHPSD